ncbi:type II secretion system protein GspK [Pseudomonas sp. R5-89-07]|uniref:type II secretion system protein GspK n=1 Tax=Pseudomonas sp. R5-89-07 TaxID=658644 RepID=UPI000F56B72A|nr:type II secretion system protein GspK [Pseudomonas sp. R5-89-07]AZF04859.1 General secretion pathway protein K [Pseudomonas sp. R5-89-07]
MKHQRGVALLLALWVLALLSVMLGALAGWVQLQSRQAAWYRQHASAEFAAEAGLNLAVQGLLDPLQRQHWVADGRETVLPFDGVHVHIRVYSERGKLDLNSAPGSDLARLAKACGASQPQAAALAQGLEARRRDDAAPLRVIEEIRQLPGMSQALYSQMLPDLTLWSGLDRPDAAFASPLLRRALHLGSPSAVGATPGDVLLIDSRVERPGSHARVRTTLLLSPAPGSAQPYRVLGWQE